MNSDTDDTKDFSILDGSHIHLPFRGKRDGCFPVHVVRSWDIRISVKL